MKTNKYTDLINFGLTQKTLMSLNESEINTLHKNLIGGKKKETKEQTTTTTGQGVTAVSSKNPNAPTIAKNLNKQGVNVQMTEKEETDEKSQPKNPWAICHAQLGPKKTAKFERCVKDIKKQISEGKDPFAVLLENKIVALLEKHIQPKMKKKELLDLINNKKMKQPIGKISSLGMMENDTETAPTKPKTAPTKPKTVPEKPFNPYRPNPDTQTNPKAKKTEDRPEFIPLRKIEIGRRWKEDDNKKKKDGDKKKEERIFRPSNKIETFEGNEPKTAPTKPKTAPTKPKTAPEKPFNPYRPNPDTQTNPKAKKTETKEQAESPTITPTKPITKPKTVPEKPFNPYRPNPDTQTNPKAKKKMPQWLKFNNLGLNIK